MQARIRKLETYSAHADQTELVEWACDRLPVRRGIFLTHGETQALDTFREHLIKAGCDSALIHVPAIDEVFELSPAGKLPHKLEEPRAAQADVVGTDWHNDYARLLLDLSKQLQEAETNAERRQLLSRIRKALSTDI